MRGFPRILNVGRALVIPLALGAMANLATVDTGFGAAAPDPVAHIDSLLAAGQAEAAAASAGELLADTASPPSLRPALLQRLCVALQAAGRPLEARPSCEEAVRAMPTDPANHRNFAMCLQALGQLGRAAGEFQQALDLAPEQFAWRLQYARVLHDLGARREATRQIEQAARDCPECPIVDRTLADLALRAGEPQRAIAPLRRLLAADPAPALRERLAQSCWEAGRYGALDSTLADARLDSLSALEVRLWLQADRARGLADRARRIAGDTPPALAAAAERDPAVWALVAEICLEAAWPAEALTAIDRAVTIAPQDGRWQQNRAAILSRLGRDAEAAAALARARALGQGEP